VTVGSFTSRSPAARRSLTEIVPRSRDSTFGHRELVEGGMSLADAEREALARAVRQIGIEEAIVPGDLPLAGDDAGL
jgi:hypothetical protein